MPNADQLRAALALLPALFIVALVLVSVPSAARAEEPDVAELVASIDQERLRDHIDTIDEPRNATNQPDALQAAADYVQAQLESFGYPVTLDPVPLADVTFPNVTGVKEGTSCAERVLIVGAHYDSVADAPGADDNASGTAAMLEIARALSETPLPATVWFTGFTMEEDGFVGSRQMAFREAEAGTQIVGMYSLEMIAYTTDEDGGDFIAILGNEASVRLSEAYARASETYVPDLVSVVLTFAGNGEEQPDSRRSDNAPFWDAGYQALMVTDTANFRNPNYHEPTDTLDTLDLEFATDVTKAMLATTVDYLTRDADEDGEADVCTGPLAATATPTSPSAPVATPTPVRTSLDAPAASATPASGAVATATALAVADAFPDAGAGGVAASNWLLPAIAVIAAAAALVAAITFALRRAARTSGPAGRG